MAVVVIHDVRRLTETDGRAFCDDMLIDIDVVHTMSNLTRLPRTNPATVLACAALPSGTFGLPTFGTWGATFRAGDRASKREQFLESLRMSAAIDIVGYYHFFS